MSEETRTKVLASLARACQEQFGFAPLLVGMRMENLGWERRSDGQRYWLCTDRFKSDLAIRYVEGQPVDLHGWTDVDKAMYLDHDKVASEHTNRLVAAVESSPQLQEALDLIDAREQAQGQAQAAIARKLTTIRKAIARRSGVPAGELEAVLVGLSIRRAHERRVLADAKKVLRQGDALLKRSKLVGKAGTTAAKKLPAAKKKPAAAKRVRAR